MIKIDHAEVEQFLALRERAFKGIAAALAADGHCKSYEGAFQIAFPTYFADCRGDAQIAISLDCYVLGSSRHYRWTGATLGEAVANAATDIDKWAREWIEHECDERCP